MRCCQIKKGGNPRDDKTSCDSPPAGGGAVRASGARLCRSGCRGDLRERHLHRYGYGPQRVCGADAHADEWRDRERGQCDPFGNCPLLGKGQGASRPARRSADPGAGRKARRRDRRDPEQQCHQGSCEGRVPSGRIEGDSGLRVRQRHEERPVSHPHGRAAAGLCRSRQRRNGL